MKKFEDYKDGEWVTLKKTGHPWDGMQFQAYPSKWTLNAFRLKYGDREIIVDISEMVPLFSDESALPTLPVGNYVGVYGVQD